MQAFNIHAIVSVMAIYAVGVLSPGPNFMVVAQRAVARGRTQALATVLGVVSVNALWASASLFGISVVFALFPWTWLLLRVAGATYLVWAGVRLWRHARAPLSAPSEATNPRDGLWRAYRAGLATNLSNAKAIAFYGSAFSAAAPKPGETATLWVALALVLVIALIWYGLVAVALSTGMMAAAYRRAKVGIERACGAAMIGFGVRLATER